MIPHLNSLVIFTGGNTKPPTRHHKPRKTGRLWAITTTLQGDRVVYYRVSNSVRGGAA